MKNLPYFRWFPADAETDEAYSCMNDAEVGFFHRCLNKSWINNGLPSDPAELARLLKVTTAYLGKMWGRVGPKFQVSETTGRLVNSRQEIERSKAIHKSEQSSNAVSERERKRNVPSSGDVSSDHPRAPARADSDSVSGFGSNKNQNDAALNLEIVEADNPLEIMAELTPIYLAAGVPIATKHRQLCIQLLMDVPPAKRHGVVDYVKHCLLTGKWRDPTTTKGLLNLLRDGDWDVPIVERVLPVPRRRTAAEEGHDQAARAFMARGGDS